MSSGWCMRGDDDGRTVMRGPCESELEAVAIVGLELADLQLLREALLAALEQLGPPPAGVGGIDRPKTEHDELDRLLRSVEHSTVQPPVATY